jgi:hypothetical protein
MNRVKALVVFSALLLVLAALGVLVIRYAYPAADLWMVWRVYSGYVETFAAITGWNRYLVTAIALALFVPFYYGVTLVVWNPFNQRKRQLGVLLIVALALIYNLSLYRATRETAFAFATGAPQKWYAITPAGVRFYDRPGTDPEFGLRLEQVTPENIHRLRVALSGELASVDPKTVRLFNPNTGQPEAWYYRSPDGLLEFYNRPGFHPHTGASLQPVTPDVYLEWRKGSAPQQKSPRASGSAPRPTHAPPVAGPRLQAAPRGATWERIPASDAQQRAAVKHDLSAERDPVNRGAVKRELPPEPDTGPSGAIREPLPQSR